MCVLFFPYIRKKKMGNLGNRVTRGVFWRPDAIYMVTQMVTHSKNWVTFWVTTRKKGAIPRKNRG